MSVTHPRCGPVGWGKPIHYKTYDEEAKHKKKEGIFISYSKLLSLYPKHEYVKGLVLWQSRDNQTIRIEHMKGHIYANWGKDEKIDLGTTIYFFTGD